MKEMKLYDMTLTEEKHPVLTVLRTIHVPDGVDAHASCPENSAALFELTGISHAAEENLYMMAVTSFHEVLGLFLISRGTITQSYFTPREIFLRALSIGAARILLAHNHPHGKAKPSDEDIKATKRIKDAGQLLGIPLSDHIILTDHDFYSFAEAMPMLGE